MARLTANTEDLAALNNEIKQVENMTTLVKEAAAAVGLDEVMLGKKIDATENYQFGQTIGLMNLFGRIMQWPSFTDTDNSLVPARKAQLAIWFDNKMGHSFSATLFNKFRTARGYTSFATDDLELIDAKEPNWETLTPILVAMDQHLQVEIHDANLDKAKWAMAQAKAETRASDEIAEKTAELELHKQKMAKLAAA